MCVCGYVGCVEVVPWRSRLRSGSAHCDLALAIEGKSKDKPLLTGGEFASKSLMALEHVHAMVPRSAGKRLKVQAETSTSHL